MFSWSLHSSLRPPQRHFHYLAVGLPLGFHLSIPLLVHGGGYIGVTHELLLNANRCARFRRARIGTYAGKCATLHFPTSMSWPALAVVREPERACPRDLHSDNRAEPNTLRNIPSTSQRGEDSPAGSGSGTNFSISPLFLNKDHVSEAFALTWNPAGLASRWVPRGITLPFERLFSLSLEANFQCNGMLQIREGNCVSEIAEFL